MALGDAVLAAKHQLPIDGNDYRDVVLGWSLLGDPALVVGP